MKEKQIAFYMTGGVSDDMDSDQHFACEIGDAIHRFIGDDWGNLCEDDKALNRRAKTEGGRVFAAYSTSRGKIYIIADDALADDQVTTVLYASEY